MEHEEFNESFNCVLSVGTCFLLSVLYVSSLYIWNSKHDRNHPTTIKKRFLSVFIMMLLSPLILYLSLNKELLKKITIWEIMGLKISGFIPAIILPLLLTMILFLGPICMQLQNSDLKWNYGNLLKANFQNLIWWRNHIVAPLSEEFTFRACMFPTLFQCFNPITAVFICPLFFGVAHFHHMVERIQYGEDFKRALIISCFQFFYTTLFGTYSAFLFLRTGHFVAPFIAHAFCNHMGFPDFGELASYTGYKRTIMGSLFVLGFTIWCLLLNSLTNPNWYHNKLYNVL